MLKLPQQRADNVELEGSENHDRRNELRRKIHRAEQSELAPYSFRQFRFFPDIAVLSFAPYSMSSLCTRSTLSFVR